VSTRDADWKEKLDVYGCVVPVCLVVDMQIEKIAAFWDPSPKAIAHTSVPFGKPLHIPAPFDFDLDTDFKADAG
jgi:hypothetical protein